MEIEEVKALWRESNRRLEASMRLNTALLQRGNLRAADSSLKRMGRRIALELAFNIAGIVLLGAFIGNNLHAPQFLIPAIALDAYAIALVTAGARQLGAIGGVDFDEPVVAIQTRLERLKLGRIRATLLTLLFAPLMWVPLLVVTTRGLFGIDVYGAGWTWLVVNALFGLAVIPLAVLTARRYGPGLQRFTPLRDLADGIAGRGLADALHSLDAIRRFEEE